MFCSQNVKKVYRFMSLAQQGTHCSCYLISFLHESSRGGSSQSEFLLVSKVKKYAHFYTIFFTCILATCVMFPSTLPCIFHHLSCSYHIFTLYFLPVVATIVMDQSYTERVNNMCLLKNICLQIENGPLKITLENMFGRYKKNIRSWEERITRFFSTKAMQRFCDFENGF